MYGDFCEKLAKLVVNYSVKVKPGDKVGINGGANAEDLICEIYRESIIAGGNVVYMNLDLANLKEIFFENANEDQLKYLNPLSIEMVKFVTKYINVFSSYNTRSLTNIDPKKITTSSAARKPINEIFNNRAAKGELDWNICPYPSLALAQEASLGIDDYKEFIYKALGLNQKDPIKYWQDIEIKQNKIVDVLNKGKEMRIIGEDTDLILSIQGRKWINCCGQKNLPDGEVFTSPIENAVNGTIRFTYPGIYMGQEIENIWLKFKDGKVIEFDATKGKNLMEKLLELENAKILGELAIGTNYGIQKFTKNMLFDEKIGGTIHLALGNGFPEVGSKNISPIHWDILKDMKNPGSKILLDNTIIYEKGKWNTSK